MVNGEPIVKVVTLTVGDKVINTEAGTSTCTVTVPAADGPFYRKRFEDGSTD